MEPPDAVPMLARADALMRRRQTIPGEPEDVPLLTEIVQEETAQAASIDPSVLTVLSSEIAKRIRAQLAAEIPSLVEAALHTVLTDLSGELQRGVTETTDHAIRTFVTEWQPPR